MIYFTGTEKQNILSKNKNTIIILLSITSLFVIVTPLIVILNDKIGSNISMVLEIIISTLYLSYLLITIQFILNNKRLIALFDKLTASEEIIEGEIIENSQIITINQLTFIKILINTQDGLRQLYLFEQFKTKYNDDKFKKLIITGNYIKGELNNEAINS